MKYTKSSLNTAKGPADWFTGDVYIDPIRDPDEQSAVGCAHEVKEIRPGDVVYIEPGEEHWHGATPERFMSHVAIQEADEQGQVVTWLDHVTDDEYKQQ
jgi:hypothetical protein